MRACVCCVCTPPPPPPLSPASSPYSPARSSHRPGCQRRGEMSCREVGPTTPERAEEQAMRGESVGSASAPRGVNPFDAQRCALLRPLDLRGEVEGEAGSSRSVCGGTAAASQRSAGSAGAEDRSPRQRPLGSSPPASAEHSLCLGAAPPAKRNQIAGAAGRRTNIINPAATSRGSNAPPQLCSPPLSAQQSFSISRVPDPQESPEDLGLSFLTVSPLRSAVCVNG